MSAADRNDTGADADDPDQLRAFLTTFKTYVAQQHEAGVRWYLDDGPPESEAPLPAAAPEAAAAVPEASRAAESTAVRQSPPASQQVFTDVCTAFVHQTLEHIARHREAVPAQGDIFTAKDEVVSLDPAAKQIALAELAAEVAACSLCKLQGGRTQTVFGVGNSDADLVLIGEAPGAEEDRQGVPFVGRSGQLLTEILKAIGFAREDVYICNILKCRPPQNRDPEREEVSSCEVYLQRQLEIIEPRIILCLGRVAAQTLLGTTATLGALRESVHFYVGIPVMVTFHPAALLRNAHLKRPCWDDVRKVQALHDALR